MIFYRNYGDFSIDFTFTRSIINFASKESSYEIYSKEGFIHELC